MSLAVFSKGFHYVDFTFGPAFDGDRPSLRFGMVTNDGRRNDDSDADTDSDANSHAYSDDNHDNTRPHDGHDA